MPHKIYVGNLKPDTSKDELKQFCEQFGPVEAVHIAMDYGSGNNRGFGFVSFDEEDGMNKALAADEPLLNGRPIKIGVAKKNQ